MKTAKFFSMVVAVSLLFASCKKDSDDVVPGIKVVDRNVSVNENSASVNARIKRTNQLLEVDDVSYTNAKYSQIPPKVDLTKNYVFKLVAEVNAPSVDQKTLQATHVRIVDHYAFVTYNYRGDEYLGGIDIFDVADIRNPQIIGSYYLNNMDVSSVDYYNNKLYIVGAYDLDHEAPGHLVKPGMLEILSLDADKKIVAVDTILNLNAYMGTDVRVTEQNIFTTAGSNGGLKVFSHNFSESTSVDLDNARAIDIHNDLVYVLRGEPGRINIFNKSDVSPVKAYSPDGAMQKEAKSGLVVTDKYILTALNEGGMKVLNLDGSIKQQVPKPLVPDGENPENFVSNSVSVQNDLVLIANGEAGLYVGGLIESIDDSLAVIGKINFTDHESVNFVAMKDSVIFVATGLGGLKILTVGIDDGLPPVIIPVKPCPTLYSSIAGMFPEYQNNMVVHADLFAPGAGKRIVITKETEVFLTFVTEGAGWKNSFGYYTYDITNPPTAGSPLNKKILFPNASLKNEGGGLDTGTMVQVGTSKFKPGTVIGFYLVAKGWEYGTIDDGYYTMYTDSYLNRGGYQQHVLFKEKKCGDIVMTFEDIAQDDPLPYSDNDFNDIIFTVSDTKDVTKATTSFDMTGIPEK